ncbi:MAG: hypothetical protein WEA09_13275 [Gemmatimonadota bacterium]
MSVPRAVTLAGFVVLAGAVWYLGPASRVTLDDPDALVAAARGMLNEQRLDSLQHQEWIEPADAPPSLRISRLKYVQVHGNHVDIVTGRSPDGPWGYRVWAVDATTVHEDEPTEHPEVFWYSYSNDLPVSPTNYP